jgi:bifunctional non-homologous end joining protein LigD
MARLPTAWPDAETVPAPMLAVLARLPDVPLTSDRLVYEPKYDGIRLVAVVQPGGGAAVVQLWSRNGRDKSAQFPEAVRALRALSASLAAVAVLDGELVALDARGEPTSFTRLQGRMHLTGAPDIEAQAAAVPTAFIVFDLLRVGSEDLRPRPLTLRRARLESLLHTHTSERLREGAYVAGDGRRLLERAEAEGWEGLIVKDADSRYEAGRRSKAWRKLKLTRRVELVIGGWTDPKGTRQALGALVVGELVPGGPTRGRSSGRPGLRYAGNVGTGFDARTLEMLARRLAPLARPSSPFTHGSPPKGTHWVEPVLVCEVAYAEWTPDRHLRHPVFLGVREDVRPQGIGDEQDADIDTDTHASDGALRTPALDGLIDTLHALEDKGRDGTLAFEDGSRLDVTNLRKVFWPGSGLTKGDLFRYYVRVSPWILPVVRDRALVMKRFPNGVQGKSFYQHRAPDPLPAGVRVALIASGGDEAPVPQLIGGTLQTLLYGVQLGSISQDPWFSRVGSPGQADFVAIDLDPMPGVPFRQVLDVARWLHEAIVLLGLPAVAKTSGASGLHIYFPLAPGTSYESGQLLCQILATTVAAQHPKVATVERSVARRGRTVYVDYLQNIEGKTLASAYSARASEFAGVSTPLRWEELDTDVRPEDFTLTTIERRLAGVGDLWNPVMEGPPVDLRDVLARLERG